jgi:cytochrome P450
MKFLEMVIFETLRIYPAIPRLNREVTSDYKYKEMFIKKGSLLEILVYVIHHNPDIYPDPEKFDPYRFDEETKKTRDSNAYLPFGSGPRSCIGN